MNGDGPAIVTSKDGTPVAYWSSGHGPPLVVVHGTTADHTRWMPLLPFLEPHFTVHAMDRRGRGASGDAPDYKVEREFEDVAAVIDAVAETAASPVDLYGHSYGALCALGGATLTSDLRRLVLYEPVVAGASESVPASIVDRMEAALADGKNAEVVELLFRDVLGMPAEQMEMFKAAPSWAGRVAAAPTVPREGRAEMGHAFDRIDTSKITVPTLMIHGAESPDWLKSDTHTVAAALADVRTVAIEGQEHVADVLVPEVFASHLVGFLRAET